ncbi:MAG: hypothetical protein ACYC65_15755 [Candidatus Limnocylindrales bacterium]
MNATAFPSRERDGVDALVTDRYLEMLLAAGDRRATDGPADADLDPDVRAAARVLRRSLVRVHPSFRFQERLAARLDAIAAQTRSVAAAGGTGGAVLAFPGAVGARGSAYAEPDPLLDAILRGDLDPSDASAVDRAGRTPVPRPLIVGGAITSAAISIVGVAWVAWRAAHPADGAMTRAAHPAAGAMTRAARTVRSRRDTAAALAGGGPGGPA